MGGPEQLEQVVAGADEQPLAVHFLQSPQQEQPEATSLFDLPEHRLHRLHPQRIALPSQFRSSLPEVADRVSVVVYGALAAQCKPSGLVPASQRTVPGLLHFLVNTLLQDGGRAPSNQSPHVARATTLSRTRQDSLAVFIHEGRPSCGLCLTGGLFLNCSDHMLTTSL